MADINPFLLSEAPQEWLDFIQNSPDSTLFHHPAWINLLAEYYRFQPYWLIIKDDQGRISAGIPLMKVTDPLHRKKLVSLPFTDHCAPLYRNTAAINGLVPAILSLYAEHKIHQIELRWEYPVHPQIGIDMQYVLNRVNLDPDPGVVSARIKRKHFRNVSVAQERGVHLEMGTDSNQLQSFYQLHLQNRHKHGVPVQSWNYFQFLYDRLLRQGYGFLITAYKDHTCVAASLFLYWNRTLTEKYAATNEDGRRLLAMDIILWKAICWGCEHGMEIFDMGRTDQSDHGLRHFKNRWGAEETPLTYSFIPANQAQIRNNGPISLFQSIIRHSPLWVCRLTGELFYRYFA